MDFIKEKTIQSPHKLRSRYLCVAVFFIALLLTYPFISTIAPYATNPVPQHQKQLPTTAPQASTQDWPYTPFRTSRTQILNSRNEPVTLVGINWPGHGLPMVPEGLQYQSVGSIVAKIKDLGMNVVRLTYATEMVDDIYENEGNPVTLKESFIRALGIENGIRIYQRVIKLNPSLAGPKITRLDVFDAVAEELARQHIYVHLDNHISKAGWCCSFDDGNGWFGDTYFNTQNWVRGLVYMTKHARSWRSHISTSLRNEPRDSPSNAAIHKTYNWATWYDNMIPAMDAVHNANSDALVFVSGLLWDRTLEPVIHGSDLGGGRTVDFAKMDTGLREKIVWELHNYNNTISSCEVLVNLLNEGGYDILGPHSTTTTTTPTPPRNIAPVIMTEFGFPQDSDGMGSTYAQCLQKHLTRLNGGWMYWVLVGSYYERQGEQDFDESWGILNHDWSGWRSREVVDGYFRPFVKNVLGTHGGLDYKAHGFGV